MTAEFKIIEVLSTRKINNQQGLVFKVQWSDSKEMAFIEFNKAKEKYPLIVLDYLITRMKHKTTVAEYDQIENSKDPIQREEYLRKEDAEEKECCAIKKFFLICSNCHTQKKLLKMFDYDAMIPIESALAYPVVLRIHHLKKEIVKRSQSKTKAKMN